MMISMTEFIEKVRGLLAEQLPDTQIVSKEMVKTNDIVVDGISITAKQSNLGPVIYMESYYDDYQNERKNISEIVEDIIRVYKANVLDRPFDVSDFMDYSKIKHNIRGRLISKERNSRLLENTPHRDVLDLCLVYMVAVEMDPCNEGYIEIKDNHIEMWGVTEDDLYHQFLENRERNNDSVVEGIFDVVQEIIGGRPEFMDDATVPIYVLTNKKKNYGAVELLNETLLEKFADMKQMDIVILPSSLHEVILVPVDSNEENCNIRFYAEMVREVNDTQVAPREILSYHIYRYSRDTKELTIAA